MPPQESTETFTTAQLQRTARLQEQTVIVDMVHPGIGGAAIYESLDPVRVKAASHGGLDMQALFRAFMLPYESAPGGESNVAKEWWDLSGITIASYSITDLSAEGLTWSMEPMRRLCAQCPWLEFATTAAQMRRAKVNGHHAFFGYSQPMSGIPNHLSRVDAAYEVGMRVLMLTYNRMDYVGSGCSERVDAGLSMYGLDVVRRCNELGILVDTSHCGLQTTLDSCKYSKGPVCATHAGAAAVYAHARNKTDDALKAIAGTGGIVGIYLVPFYLSSASRVTLDQAFDHLDYVTNLIGWQHVGIGTDWPIQAPRDVLERTLGAMVSRIGFKTEDRVEVLQTLDGFSDFRQFPDVVRGLVKRGYTDEQIRGILGENFLRVFESVCH